MWLGLIGNLLRALAAYWELKAERYAHDVVEQSRAKLEALVEQRESLRDRGTESDTQLADRVHQRIIVETAHLERLSAKYLRVESGSSSGNNDGNIHSSD